MTFMIDKNKFKTDKGKKLFELLKNISNDEDFIIGVLLDVKGDEKKEKLISAIESNFKNYEFDEKENPEITDKIIALSMAIKKGKI